jgi:MFS family permease
LRGTVAPILAVHFVGSLGFSIVLPFLVYLVTKWGGNAVVYGLAGATYSAFQLVGAPLLGRWSDRVGRRKILLLSQLGTLASWTIFLVAFLLPADPVLSISDGPLGSIVLTAPLVVLFVARALDGLTGGNVSVASAYLADVTSEADRSASFGKLAVSANLGFIVGPAIAGLLGSTALEELLPVLTALAISVVATLLILFRLPEVSPCRLERDPEGVDVADVMAPDKAPCFETESERNHGLRDALALPGVTRLLAIGFLVMLGFNVFYVAFPVHAASGIGWSVTETGVFFSFLSLSMVVVQGPVLGRLSRRVSDGALALTGSVVLAASFAVIGSERTVTIYAGALLLAIGNGLMWPSIVSLLSKRAGARHQGLVQGLAGSSGAVASIVGLIVGGALYGAAGPGAFLLPAAVIAVVAILAAPLVARRSTQGGGATV